MATGCALSTLSRSGSLPLATNHRTNSNTPLRLSRGPLFKHAHSPVVRPTHIGTRETSSSTSKIGWCGYAHAWNITFTCDRVRVRPPQRGGQEASSVIRSAPYARSSAGESCSSGSLSVDHGPRRRSCSSTCTTERAEPPREQRRRRRCSRRPPGAPPGRVRTRGAPRARRRATWLARSGRRRGPAAGSRCTRPRTPRCAGPAAQGHENNEGKEGDTMLSHSSPRGCASRARGAEHAPRRIQAPSSSPGDGRGRRGRRGRSTSTAGPRPSLSLPGRGGAEPSRQRS